MKQHQAIWQHSTALVDIFNPEGRIVYINPAQKRFTGLPDDDGIMPDAASVYSPAALRTIAGLLAGDKARLPAAIELDVCSADGKTGTFSAAITFMNDETHGNCLLLVKTPTLSQQYIHHLEREKDVLLSIISTSRDASYCVEFLEPVDMSAPEHEVVRQVFENQCIWRYCNEAMSRLYRLPIHEDMNQHPVCEVFPRNHENETFIRNLIQCGFHIDGALSKDHRYDGVDVYIENDVRADIRDNNLYKFWGTVRDLSVRKRRELELQHQASYAQDILGALPDPVLVVNQDGRIEGTNNALELHLGWEVERILGINAANIIEFGQDIKDLILAAQPVELAHEQPVVAVCSDGSRLSCSATIAALVSEAGAKRGVISLKPLATAEPGSNHHLGA